MGPRGALEGEGGTWSGVISEANSLDNWRAELCGNGFYYEFNPFREAVQTRIRYLDTLVKFLSPEVNSNPTATHA